MSNDLNNLVRYVRLKGHAKTVLIMLCDMADNKTYKAWPSIKTLALYCGISERTVVRATQKLEQIGFLKKQKKVSLNGGHSSNIYTVNKSALKFYSSGKCQFDRRGTVTLTPKSSSPQSSLNKLDIEEELLRRKTLEDQRIRNEYMKEEKRKLAILLKGLKRHIRKI